MRHSPTWRAVVVLTLAGCAAGEGRDTQPRLSSPEVVSAPTAVGAAPMFAVAPTGARTVAWVSAPDSGTDGRLYVRTGAAGPSELRDSLGPIEPHGEAPPKIVYAGDGTLHALYAVVKLVPGRRFPMSTLRLASSRDGGATWLAPTTVAPDSGSSRNFHALHAAPEGTLYVSWLESAAGKSGTFITHSSDGGRVWSPVVRVDAAESCPCCRTALATASDGTLYLAWRTVLPGNVRDIVVARSADKGATWGAPVRVHADDWVFDGCPHAGPSMQVDSAGRLHIAWWTGKAKAAGAYYARSSDGAKTFTTPIALRTAELSAPAHVQLALGAGKTVVVTWDDGTVKVPRVVMRVSRDGGDSFGSVMTLSDGAEAATFPVLAVTGQQVTVAWAQTTAATHAHEAASRPNMKDPKATMGLPAVGASRVLVRSGAIE
jgi:BNR repeat protein